MLSDMARLSLMTDANQALRLMTAAYNDLQVGSVGNHPLARIRGVAALELAAAAFYDTITGERVRARRIGLAAGNLFRAREIAGAS